MFPLRKISDSESYIFEVKLNTINLGGNVFEAKGCKGLSRGFWPKMHYLYLGRTNITKMETKYGRKAWHTFPRLNGMK